MSSKSAKNILIFQKIILYVDNCESGNMPNASKTCRKTETIFDHLTDDRCLNKEQKW